MTIKKKGLDEEERDILESYDKGEWQSVEHLDAEKQRHSAYARNTLKKDKRVNIRLTSKDLEEFQALAAEQGIPYQTLISSVLHRYVNGSLVPGRRSNNVID